MKINIPENLKKLAELFPVPLYAVGGFVRDSLLNYEQHDIDISSPLPPDEVKTLLKNSEFGVSDGSKKLLTLIIKNNGVCYEYTTFRKDSYTTGHRPCEVTATTDLKEDALRRDFKVNAIYYDIKNECLVDPLNGLGDLKLKILSTTRSPEEVFSEDGLRLMRLARMAASLGFEIEENTLIGAKANAKKIDDISAERIRDELDKILSADVKYGTEKAQTRGLEILNRIGVLERILPELTEGIGLVQNPKYHKYDVFGHILKTVEYAPLDIRLAALFHDIAKPFMKKTTGLYYGHDKQGQILSKEILKRLKYPNSVIEETSRLVGSHMFNLADDARRSTIRKFILNNRDILYKFVELRYADAMGSGFFEEGILPSAQRVLDEYEKMKEEKVPFELSELKVDGNDLMQVDGLPPSGRGKCLNDLLIECVCDPENFNTREKQLKYIQNYTRRSKTWTTE